MADEEKGAIPKPTKEQINEVVNPSLSRDSFQVGDKEIPIQILPIDDEEKVIAIFLPAIKDLFSDLPEKITAREVIARIDPVSLSKYKKILVETITIMAQRHDASITKDIVGKSMHTAAIMSAIIRQLEKNQIADMVSSFFFKLSTMLPRSEAKSPQSPPS